MLHLCGLEPTEASGVEALLDLPEDDAQRQEQEETREENREKHKEVDASLVLPEKDAPTAAVVFTVNDQIKPSTPEIIDILREGEVKKKKRNTREFRHEIKIGKISIFHLAR